MNWTKCNGRRARQLVIWSSGDTLDFYNVPFLHLGVGCPDENRLTCIYLCIFPYISIKKILKRQIMQKTKSSGNHTSLSLLKLSPLPTQFRTFTNHRLFEAHSPHKPILWWSLGCHGSCTKPEVCLFSCANGH